MASSTLDRARRCLGPWARAAFAGSTLLSVLLVASAPWCWVGELAASFGFQLGGACLLAALALALLGAPLRASTALVAGAWLSGSEATLALRGPPSSDRAVELRLAIANLRWDNPTPEAAIRRVAEEGADVVYLMEVTPTSTELAERWLTPTHPHRVLVPRNPSFLHSAIYSRLPFKSDSVLMLPTRGPADCPAIEVELDLGQRSVLLHAIHTPRAGRAWRLRWRNDALDAIAGRPVAAHTPRILAGDLNLSPTSPVFRQLLRGSPLRDTRLGFGRTPTWSAASYPPFSLLPVFGGLPLISGVPIDHVLAQGPIEVLDRRSAAVPGSDHQAVVVDFAFGAPPP